MFDYETDPDFENGPEGEEQFHAWHEQLTQEILQTAANINTMEYYFIKLLSRYDLHECWTGEGLKSFAHWLNWKCGIGPMAAREKIRVARCLRVLPRIDETFRTGRVSYSKVRAMTRCATPENEEQLLDASLDLTAAHVEQLVRRYRKVPTPGDLKEQYREMKEPYVTCWQDDEGMVHLHARLPAEDGVLVEKAIEKMTFRVRQSMRPKATEEQEGGNVSAETSPEEPTDKIETSVPAETPATRFGPMKAKALALMAEHYLASADEERSLRGSDKYQVVIQVNANDAHQDCEINGANCTYLDEGKFLAPHVARMLACDAAKTTVVGDDDGKVLNISRSPASMARPSSAGSIRSLLTQRVAISMLATKLMGRVTIRRRWRSRLNTTGHIWSSTGGHSVPHRDR